MITEGGSYIRKDGKLTLVGRTGEPKPGAAAPAQDMAAGAAGDAGVPVGGKPQKKGA